jgi:hypothetical protein
MRKDIFKIDNNDNAPQFERQLYEMNVTENTTPGTEIVRVKATDADEGLNGEIEYSFGSHTQENVLSVFNIDAISGQISLKGKLDYESKSNYEIDVTAKDKGNPRMDGHCSVHVDLLDVNDNAPQFLNLPFSMLVSEDSEPGDVLYQLC